MEYSVPDFNSGQLAVGPVLVYSTCTEYYAVESGELVFSQTIGNINYDGSVKYLNKSLDYVFMADAIMDTNRFNYGFAIVNISADAKAITYQLYDQSTKQDLPEKLLLTLAGKEQKIFVFSDIVPDLKGGLYKLVLESTPYKSGEIFVLLLKFNKKGSFSTGVINY